VERSRVTVEYSHLPGQVWEHEANGVYCITRGIGGRTPDDIALGQVLEALEVALELWGLDGVHAGFPPSVTDHEEEFRLVVPSYVEFDVWPATLFCGNRRCGHVRPFCGQDRPRRPRCSICGTGRYQQLPYFQVHSCGALRELLIPSCEDHPRGPVGFEDSASFYTAGFRCLTCRRPLKVEFRGCTCRLEWRGGGDRSERSLTPVTTRDTRAFFGHHLTMVSVGGPRLTDAMRSPRGVHYALGHYAGTVTELAGLADEARGRRRPADDRGAEALRRLREQYPDLPESLLAPLALAVEGARGDEPALEATERLLSPATLDSAHRDRRLMERAFLFSECAVDDLTGIASRMRHAGHARLSQRIEEGLNSAAREGIGRISVVRDFPVALVGYGYTRESRTPAKAKLAPLPHEGDKLPLVTVEARTEALLVELSPLLLWQWCAANGWAAPPPPASDSGLASGWLLDQMYASPKPKAAVAIRRVTHAYSHLLMHALAYHSSYSSNSVAEYLLERQASTLIYVAKYTSFNLGGLTALAEQHLQRWVESAADSAWSCVHDPICLSERGGCHKCLAVAFGCERFNVGLDRGYLVGGGPQDISEGFLFTARQAAHR
jgi:hypothetical protein